MREDKDKKGLEKDALISVEDLPDYKYLPAPAKEEISKTYRTLREEINKEFSEIKISSKYTDKEFLEEILPRDEKVDDKPLRVSRYRLEKGEDFTVEQHLEGGHELLSGGTTVSKEIMIQKIKMDVKKETIAEGRDTDVYITDRRIIMLDTRLNEYPTLERHPEIRVSHVAEDSFRVFSIPTKHISNIFIDIRNRVSSTAVFRRLYMVWLFLLGFLTILFGVVWASLKKGGDSSIILLSSVLVGIFLIILAAKLKGFKGEKLEKEVDKTSLISLSVIEPFYHRRAILHLEVDTTVHDLEEIVDWIRRLQQRCKEGDYCLYEKIL
ncbi:MAG TPA: hypothetical protein ENL44_02960 [Thermoplasmatales archaeon]|nr:hypothetical protein [Thermoplasmatales archaeon]